MRFSIDVGSELELKLYQAVLLYKNDHGNRHMATVHGVVQQNSDGSPVLGAGQLLSTASLRELARQLRTGCPVEFLPDHGADDFQGEDWQSKPWCYRGVVLRCFRLRPRSGQLAALLDGAGKRPATRRRTGGLLPSLHRASGFIGSFPEDHSPARRQSLAAGWRNHPRPELHPCSEKGRCPAPSAVVDQWAAVGPNHIAQKALGSDLSPSRGVVQVADDFSTQQPEIVYVPANGLRGKTR